MRESSFPASPPPAVERPPRGRSRRSPCTSACPSAARLASGIAGRAAACALGREGCAARACGPDARCDRPPRGRRGKRANRRDPRRERPGQEQEQGETLHAGPQCTLSPCGSGINRQHRVRKSTVGRMVAARGIRSSTPTRWRGESSSRADPPPATSRPVPGCCGPTVAGPEALAARVFAILESASR